MKVTSMSLIYKTSQHQKRCEHSKNFLLQRTTNIATATSLSQRTTNEDINQTYVVITAIEARSIAAKLLCWELTCPPPVSSSFNMVLVIPPFLSPTERQIYSSLDKRFHRPNAALLFLTSFLRTLFYKTFRLHTAILRRRYSLKMLHKGHVVA
jgi:hypothetical protein